MNGLVSYSNCKLKLSLDMYNSNRSLYHVKYNDNTHGVKNTSMVYKFHRDYYELGSNLTFHVVKVKKTDVDHMCRFVHEMFNGEQWFTMNAQQLERFNYEWFG